MLDWNLETLRHGPLPAERWILTLGSRSDSAALLRFKWWIGRRYVQGWGHGRHWVGRMTRDRRSRPWHRRTVPGALPLPGLMILAAALPHRSGIVLPVAELAGWPPATRLGCVLETLGRMQTIIGGVKTDAWAVRLLYFDVPRETFWFSDDWTLLKLDCGGQVEAFAITSPTILPQLIPPNRLVRPGSSGSAIVR